MKCKIKRQLIIKTQKRHIISFKFTFLTNRLSAEYNILSKQIHLLKIILKELINLEQAHLFSQDN